MTIQVTTIGDTAVRVGATICVVDQNRKSGFASANAFCRMKSLSIQEPVQPLSSKALTGKLRRGNSIV